MRGGALPPALLCAALGFALAFVRGRRLGLSIGLLIFGAVLVEAIRFPLAWREAAFIGLWLSTIAAAASVHLPGGPPPKISLAFSLNAGIWSGAVISVSGQPLDLLKALPAVLFVLPAAWLVARQRGVFVKVAASWLIAISCLCAVLPLIPTPGYMPDHMD